MKFAAQKCLRRPRAGGDPVSFAVSLSEETPLEWRRASTMRGDDDDSGVPQ